MINATFISDTHTYHNEVELSRGDIFFITGDFTDTGLREEVFNFFNWLNTQSKEYKHIVFIAGNHDNALILSTHLNLTQIKLKLNQNG